MQISFNNIFVYFLHIMYTFIKRLLHQQFEFVVFSESQLINQINIFNKPKFNFLKPPFIFQIIYIIEEISEIHSSNYNPKVPIKSYFLIVL